MSEQGYQQLSWSKHTSAKRTPVRIRWTRVQALIPSSMTNNEASSVHVWSAASGLRARSDGEANAVAWLAAGMCSPLFQCHRYKNKNKYGAN
eukprot:352223-Chlamydomonas_euryale.AAC.14